MLPFEKEPEPMSWMIGTKLGISYHMPIMEQSTKVSVALVEELRIRVVLHLEYEGK